MNLKISFNILIFTLITLVSHFTLASPAGFHNIHGLVKPNAIPYLAPAGTYTCSLNSLGWVNCWGSNGAGQHGNNTLTGSNKQLPIRSGIIQMDTARSSDASVSGTTYAITNSGVLMSWGDNIYGKLGTGVNGGASYTPQIVDVNTRYKFINSQFRHTCAITNNDMLKCWGYNSDGQLGDGSTAQKNSPVNVDAGTTYKVVSVGAYHSCGITTAGALKCWGSNSNNQLGDGTSTQRLYPVVIDLGTSYTTVSLGLIHSCGITTTNVLKCWGGDAQGQLGDGAITLGSLTPTVVDLDVSYNSVSAADNTTCAITTAGILKCWGENFSGQIGNNTTTTQSTPVIIDTGTTYVSISTGGDHTCGVTTGKIIKCWGLNNNGQLGISTAGGSQNTPQIILPP